MKAKNNVSGGYFAAIGEASELGVLPSLYDFRKRIKLMPLPFITLILRPWPSRNALREALIKAGNKLEWGDDVLEKMPLVKIETTVTLVCPTTTELGCSTIATHGEIYIKALKKYRLKLCHPQVGPELLLAPCNSPRRNLWIAMKPIGIPCKYGSGPIPEIFKVYRRELDREISESSVCVNNNVQWVFEQP